MTKAKVAYIRCTPFFIFLIIAGIHFFPYQVKAQDPVKILSSNQFIDPDGFFKIVPPKGWNAKKYHDDPRGKVAFEGPDGTELRVLAKGIDNYSYNHMLEEFKSYEKELGINTGIEEFTFLANPALKRVFIFKGLKILFIDFILGNSSHNLMYSAPPEQFETYHSLAMECLNTYDPSLKEISPEEVLAHSVARSLRLSKVFLENQNYTLALAYVNEGLDLDSTNAHLIGIKEEIEIKKSQLNESSTSPNESQESKETPLLFWILLSIGGAVVFVFQKPIAAGTSAPGFARLSTPVIGIVMMILGIADLFENGHTFLGILTIVLALLVLITPVFIPAIAKITGFKV